MTMRHVAAAREAHVRFVEVDATSKKDAIDKVAAGGGTEIDGILEFSHRLPPPPRTPGRRTETRSPVKKKATENRTDGTQEEWIPRTAHEIAVGMFHGLPNILVPAKHHLAKLGSAEAKTAHAAVVRALGMVSECADKMARVPGPIRAGFWEGKTLVVVESETSRVEADFDENLISQVNVRRRKDANQPWTEVTVWDSAEWREPGGEAFEAIVGVIIKVMTGQEIENPACA